jgi:hypothetical protein
MSLQMVQYRPSDMKYPGDSKMQKATQTNKRKHGGLEESLVESVMITSRESPTHTT